MTFLSSPTGPQVTGARVKTTYQKDSYTLFFALTYFSEEQVQSCQQK